MSARSACVCEGVCVSSAAQAKHIIASASTALAATANACCLLYAAAAAASAGNLCSPPLPAPPLLHPCAAVLAQAQAQPEKEFLM